MLESSTPLLVGPDVIGAPGGYRNVTDLLARRAEIAPDHAIATGVVEVLRGRGALLARFASTFHLAA